MKSTPSKLNFRQVSFHFENLQGIKSQFNLQVTIAATIIIVKAHQYFFVSRLESVASSPVEIKRKSRLPNELTSIYFANLQKLENYLRILYVLFYLTFIKTASTKIPKLAFQSHTTAIFCFNSTSIFEIEIVIDNT